MIKRKCIAVVGNKDTREGFLKELARGRIHSGWTNARNFLGEISALKEIGNDDLYGLIIVDVNDWSNAAIMGEQIHDGLRGLEVKIPVVVLDERKVMERREKITLVPRKFKEIFEVARSLSLTD